MDKVVLTLFTARIVSMDQFRGYTVAGMFLVNFVGGLAAFPEVLKHHNGHPYFSYADTIMPSFMFAAGFSYRLTTLRRLAQQGAASTYGHVAGPQPGPGAGLAGHVHARGCRRVQEMGRDDAGGIWKFVGMLLKANLWEVLAIIGVTQILLIPVIAASVRVRTIALVACAIVHLANLVLVQLLLRLRQAELAGRIAGADRGSRPGTEGSSARSAGRSPCCSARSPTTS